MKSEFSMTLGQKNAYSSENEIAKVHTRVLYTNLYYIQTSDTLCNVYKISSWT